MGWLSGAYRRWKIFAAPRSRLEKQNSYLRRLGNPRALEYERKWRERQQAYRDRFNARQQKRYEKWLKKGKAAS